MLFDFIAEWLNRAIVAIHGLYQHIFPEYPDFGIVILTAGVLLVIFHAVQLRPTYGLKIAGIAILALSILLYITHLLLTFFKIAI